LARHDDGLTFFRRLAGLAAAAIGLNGRHAKSQKTPKIAVITRACRLAMLSGALEFPTPHDYYLATNKPNTAA
jgi:hypothetical protein